MFNSESDSCYGEESSSVCSPEDYNKNMIYSVDNEIEKALNLMQVHLDKDSGMLLFDGSCQVKSEKSQSNEKCQSSEIYSSDNTESPVELNKTNFIIESEPVFEFETLADDVSYDGEYSNMCETQTNCDLNEYHPDKELEENSIISNTPLSSGAENDFMGRRYSDNLSSDDYVSKLIDNQLNAIINTHTLASDVDSGQDGIKVEVEGNGGLNYLNVGADIPNDEDSESDSESSDDNDLDTNPVTVFKCDTSLLTEAGMTENNSTVFGKSISESLATENWLARSKTKTVASSLTENVMAWTENGITSNMAAKNRLGVLQTGIGKDKSGSAYSCQVCGLRFSMFKMLERHLRTHYGHSKTGKVTKLQKYGIEGNPCIHKCDVCNKHIKGIWNFRQHKEKHARGPIIGKRAASKKRFKKTGDLTVKPVHKKPSKPTEKRPIVFETPVATSVLTEIWLAESEDTAVTSLLKTNLPGGSEIHVTSKMTTENKLGATETVFKNHSSPKSHKCKVCDSRFNNTKLLKNHMLTHYGDRENGLETGVSVKKTKDVQKNEIEFETNPCVHKCEICSKYIKGIWNYKQHKEKHARGPVGKRIASGKWFEKNKILKAAQDKARKQTTFFRKNKFFQCRECGKTVMGEKKLKEHVVLNKCCMRVKCEVCGVVCKGLTNVRKHAATHNNKQLNIFSKTCSSDSGVKDHMVVDPGEKSSSQKERNSDSSSVILKPFVCEVCSKRFKRKFELGSHMKVHSSAKAYKCKLCSRTFRFSASLTSHTRTHTGEKPHKCIVCGKAFAQANNLKKHILAIHAGERNFECDICGKWFTESGSLRRHKILHGKPHKCPVCGDMCGMREDLVQHMKKNHWDYRPHQCEVCNLRFFARRDLTRHLVIHTGERPFKCLKCGKGFTQSAALGVHKRIHLTEKPFQCDVCQRRFTQRMTLQAHLLTHTGEKPHGCPCCDRRFTRKWSLTLHMTNMH